MGLLILVFKIGLKLFFAGMQIKRDQAMWGIGSCWIDCCI